jgi:hypothetical protein
MTTPATQTLREAAAAQLKGMKDAGVEADADVRWVWIKVGPIPFAYPNTRARKRLVQAHDLHHLLTGYGTDLIGEAELGAWELGTGLRDRSAVRYAIRIFGFMLPRFPGRLRTAFLRGRQCQNLLGRPLDEATLSRSVGELRRELGLERPATEPNQADRREFRRWSAKAVAIVWGPLLPIAAAVAWSLA